MTNPDPALTVPFEDVAKFVRQLSHDIRNHLGSMDLQSAFIAELVTDPEGAEELRKLREMISGAARAIQSVTASLRVATPNSLTLGSGLFIEDFRQRFQKRFPEEYARISWVVAPQEVPLSIDLEMLFTALAELCRNALFFQDGSGGAGGAGTGVEVEVGPQPEGLLIEIRQHSLQPGPAPETWGLAPLVTTRRGGYGLGLFHARQILAVNGGDVKFSHNPETGILTSRVMLPMASGTDDVP